MPQCAHASEALVQTVEAAEPLELQLAETRRSRMPAARSISASVQIGSSSMSGTVETDATAALASQSSESQGCSNNSMPAGIERRRKAHAVVAVEGAVGVEPQCGPLAGGALDDGDAFQIGGDILADLDLEGAKALRQP